MLKWCEDHTKHIPGVVGEMENEVGEPTIASAGRLFVTLMKSQWIGSSRVEMDF